MHIYIRACFWSHMARGVVLLVAYWAIALLVSSSSPSASAKIVEYSFHIQNSIFQRLCQQQVIPAVNGLVPGPTIFVDEGDTLVMHVFNNSPYNLTIHLHGVLQLRNAWYDGPEYVTQCPIQPGNSFTYTSPITGQEGTLLWHAHVGWLHATVHGALIIRPRDGNSYPFPKPDGEFPIILGEWWNRNINDVEKETESSGGSTKVSDALTINGLPGDLYQCSSGTYKIQVVQGKTYLLRIINAALHSSLFFKIANHKVTVVAVDASYTNPMVTNVVFIAPGQTVDVLLAADQLPASYYMAASAYESLLSLDFDKTTTTGIMAYENAISSIPLMPILPTFFDTPTVHKFTSSLTGLVNGPNWAPVPLQVDEHMLITVNLGLIPCEPNAVCKGPLGMRLASSLNNVSMELPTKLSMLQASFYNVKGIYTTDFPNQPPLAYDYTNPLNILDISLITTSKSTKVKKLRFNSTVEIVFQNSALLGGEMHPIHLHGLSFYVLAQGFGNYNPVDDPRKFNLVNPQVRNTVSVPVDGWVVIRFQANNPGVWFMHCHIDLHVTWGMAMAFEVENGPTPETMLPPPPTDLPQC